MQAHTPLAQEAAGQSQAACSSGFLREGLLSGAGIDDNDAALASLGSLSAVEIRSG